MPQYSNTCQLRAAGDDGGDPRLISSVRPQIERIEHELAELTKRERRNDSLEKRASRPVVPTTGKVRALSAQATALSTYDAFPLEAAKARLLESLK